MRRVLGFRWPTPSVLMVFQGHPGISGRGADPGPLLGLAKSPVGRRALPLYPRKDQPAEEAAVRG